MPLLAKLGRLSDRLVEFAAIVLLLAMLASVFLGVVFRGLNRPLAWTDEMAQSLLVWVGFVGWIIASRRGSHIRINVFLDFLTGTPRAAAEVVIQAAVAVLGAIMLVKSPILIERNIDVEWVSLPLSMALIYLPVPIAGAAVILQALVEIVRVLSGGRPQSGVAAL
jgi:TRAP-type C4-dicarboxylate transport system permease small subunit